MKSLAFYFKKSRAEPKGLKKQFICSIAVRRGRAMRQEYEVTSNTVFDTSRISYEADEFL